MPTERSLPAPPDDVDPPARPGRRTRWRPQEAWRGGVRVAGRSVGASPYGWLMSTKLRAHLPAGVDRRGRAGARGARRASGPGRGADRTLGLSLGEPFEPRWQLLVESRRAPTPTAARVVLKVAWQHSEALHEAEGLAALGGQGAVEVCARSSTWHRPVLEAGRTATPP